MIDLFTLIQQSPFTFIYQLFFKCEYFMKGTSKGKQSMPIVEIKVVTWNKDSHGLFDYESKTLTQKKFIIESSSRVYRNSTTSDVEVRTLQELKKDKSLDLDHTVLAEISKKEQGTHENRYYVNIDQKVQINAMEIQNPNQEDAYLIVRSLKNKEGQQKGYALQIGDVIKLGRIEYHVCEMKLQTQVQSTHKNFVDLDVNKVYTVTENLKGICKICLVQEEYQDNFFVAPCNCKGSCEIVHINCLKRWIQSKIVVKQHAIAFSYNFTKFECQICKDPYPTIINKDTKNYELFVIERPNSPYIMLQSLQNESRGNKTMYMIGASTNNEIIKLGRGHQCQIRITDISVSREHAHIRFQNDRFLIIDNSSKFGTLIKLQKNLPIKYDKIAIQIGRTVITCALKPDENHKQKSTKNLNIVSGQLTKK